mmetsp:Transcript_3186/g.8137  ORF Transcript_3186/g.8137 Transcript_3186/m.8137 type:complete len:410 (+) Transcript_3186:103-1332(+)
MNQLIRRVERSRCLVRASRRSFSSSESSLAVGAQNLIAQPVPWELGYGRARPLFPNDRCVHRNLSSLSAANVAQSDGDGAQDQSVNRDPSPLEGAGLEEVTPGQVIFFLQTYGAKGTEKWGKEIFQSDFIQLCESSRPGKKRDAKVIATALKDFKRNNRFILELEGSRAAVKGMLRSMKPTWKVQDGRPRVQAALFVMEQMCDETTGLYFATETKMVDKVLKELHTGMLEMEENGFKLRIDDTSSEDDAEEELSSDEKLLKDALRLTEGVMKFLVKRKSRPEWDMKKRAKRKYMKHLQIGGGPYVTTLHLAVQISILLGGSSVAQESIVTPYADAWWKKTPVDETALKMIESAKELEEQASAEAASATDETEGGGVEEDEPSADGDSGDGVEDEGDSETVVQSDEGKKD